MHKILSILSLTLLLASCSTISSIQNSNSSSVTLTNINQNTSMIDTTINENASLPSINANQTTPSQKRVPVALKPSRAADEGCTWTQYHKDLWPVTFLYQDCANYPKNTLTLKDNTLTMNGDPFMEVGTKLPNESDVAALQRQYFKYLSPTEQENCTISTNAYYSKSNQKGITRYEFIPKPGVSEKDDGPVEHCGDHGLINAVRYFEFQEGKDTFMYLSLGQDPGWLDDGSITILQ